MKVHVILAALALAACSPQKAAEPEKPAETPAAEAPRTALASVTTPLFGARVESPIMVTGVAPGDWYFEAQFAASLVGADGKVIAEAPARAQTDWTAPGPKNFAADLEFTVTADTPATIVLREDMPPEDGPTREVRVPVVLTASP